MSYTFGIQKTDASNQTEQNYKKITNILSAQDYDIIYIKHHQNFYDQSQSYFIIIENKINNNHGKRQLRIRRVFSLSNPSAKQNQNENPEKQKLLNQQIVCQITQNQPIEIERIICGNFLYDNAIIVLKDPFEIYFLTKKSANPIKIILEQQYSLSNILTVFSFESNDEDRKKQPYLLTVYGFDSKQKNNKILTVNLTTFEIKDIPQSKDYSPKPRINNFSAFHDDRLYFFGGQLLEKKEDQQLLWSFDTEKGYWFALEMKLNAQNRIFQNYKAVVYDSGKIIIFKDFEFYLLQIYQCKISKLQLSEGSDFQSITQNNRIQGMVNFQKRIYFYTKNSLLSYSISLQKASKVNQKSTVKEEYN